MPSDLIKLLMFNRFGKKTVTLFFYSVRLVKFLGITKKGVKRNGIL